MSREEIREVFGRTLVEVGKVYKEVVVLDADLATSTKVNYFAREFPERFFEIGIAEQNMFGLAAGLALMGKVPFVSTFACFASRRACDQNSISIAYSKLNVKIIGAYGGILSGNNGATHQAIEDIAIMRAIPNMVIVEPADGLEMKNAVFEIAKHDGPVYLRVGRDAWPRVSPPDYNFQIGKACILREGIDVTIGASGVMVYQALSAAEILKGEGVEAEVVNFSTIKPIDKELIVGSARKTKAFVTCENHNILGGLGSAIAEVVVENCPVPMERVGVKDTFGECGTNEELLEKYGMSVFHIVEAVHKVIERKEKKRNVF